MPKLPQTLTVFTARFDNPPAQSDLQTVLDTLASLGATKAKAEVRIPTVVSLRPSA